MTEYFIVLGTISILAVVAAYFIGRRDGFDDGYDYGFDCGKIEED